MYISDIIGRHWLTKASVTLALTLSALIFSLPEASGQRLALKTNALEYFVLSPNLTLEARMSRRLTIQLGIAANPLTRPISDYKLTNFRVEPELRYWFNRPMARHFVALSATAGTFSFQFKNRYMTFDAVAAGISYGYALVLSRHWNMEAEIGLGLASVNGFDYHGKDNKPKNANLHKMMPVPVRCGLTFSYIFR